MIANLLLYSVILLFLGLLARALLRRHRDEARRRQYLLLLVPSFMLVPLGFYLGYRGKPDHELVIHGYRVPLDRDNRKIYVGSDALDDLNLHHRIKDTESIAPGLLELDFEPGTKQVTITQTAKDTKNIVSVNGRPLRARKLETGRTHRISFGAFNYSQKPADVLEVEIPYLKNLGLVTLAAPVFRFRGQVFDKGFSHEIGWFLSRYLPSIAVRPGAERHLAWKSRIIHRALDGTGGSLLGQAALIRYGNDYWLAANDADLQMDGAPFPNGVRINGSCTLEIESLQLGKNRGSYRFKLIPPVEGKGHVYFELIEKRHIPLPDIDVAKRLCLSRFPSAYSGTYDVLDDRFPMGGMVITREGSRFLFRGEALKPGRPYSSGKAVFTIEKAPRDQAFFLAGFALLFLASALFFPPGVLERVPLTGPVMAVGVFLHALRLILGFRAWQGDPYNENVFLDSLAAPYFFCLAVIVLVSRYSSVDLFKTLVLRLRNFMFPRKRKPLPATSDSECGTVTLAVIIYGVVLQMLFPDRLGMDFLFVIAFFALVSLSLQWLAVWERRFDRRPGNAGGFARYAPLYSLMVLLVLAMVAAPLLGGREIIPFLPGRPRPDIFIQVALLVMVAYQAGMWERERRFRVAGLLAILGVYVVVFILPLLQGAIARDMGFFVVAALPLLVMLLIASWSLDQRLKSLFAVSLMLVAALPFIFKMYDLPLDNVAAQRVAFWIDKPRLRSEHFFDYQAQVPILWSSAQGPFGGGYFEGDWYPALDNTSVNDNVAAVFIQGELGGFGSILIIALYGALALCGILFIRDERENIGGYRVWVIYGVALVFIWTAAIMFLQNFGYLPLTGKNLPLLGLDTKNDVIRYGLLMGLMLRYMRLFKE
ncbi:MAG: hypothetical protein QNK37_29540 [Acidobacteriota bacterium]|nr:hypothetical protein [Acidobacteriota bacterium]